MKKILFLVIAAAISMTAFGQSREQVQKKLDKAIEASRNEKKAAKFATWFNLGNAYAEAFRQPSKEIWSGMPAAQVKMLIGNQKVLSSTQKTLQGVTYVVDVYEDKEIYYNPAGVLEMVVVTKPVCEGDLLASAYEAYMRAADLDEKGTRKNDIAQALMMLKNDAMNDAVTEYMLGNFALASEKFEKTFRFVDNPLVNVVDTMAIYNAALTAQMASQNQRAIDLFNRCVEIGYVQDGAIYSNLAELLKQEGKVDEAKALLNKGFQTYPSNQSILVSLINLYIETNDDPSKVLELIRAAQQNEPENASLYYAEGNVFLNMKKYEDAIRCYRKSFEVDPSYIFGIYAVGNTYFEMALDAQNRMDQLDLTDMSSYEALSKEFEECLMNAIEPFEQAFQLTDQLDFQVPIADGLKQIYFRFRDKDPKYQAAYEKYEQFLKENAATYDALQQNNQ